MNLYLSLSSFSFPSLSLSFFPFKIILYTFISLLKIIFDMKKSQTNSKKYTCPKSSITQTYMCFT